MPLLGLRGARVHGVNPKHRFRFLHRLDVQVYRNRLTITAHQNAFEDFVPAGIDLLVRNVGRDENEITRIGFRRKLQMLAPSHSRLALDDVDDAFEMTVMMCAGLGVRPDRHGASPKFLRADAGEVDRGLAIHAGRRGHVGIKLITGNNANAIMLPALMFVLVRGVIGTGVVVRACHILLSDCSAANVTKLAAFGQNQAGTFRRINDLSCEGSITQSLENSMGSMTDKIKGAANEAVGKAKQGAGEAVGSDRMQGEGAAQELKGKGQKAVGDAKQAAKDVANNVADSVNKNL
jgi:uncharacterized protein YjbJ (UPF0337 family)